MAINKPNNCSITQPELVEIVVRREEHFACGCSTTRIESILVSDLDLPRCAGHGQELQRIVHTAEYIWGSQDE